MKIGNQIRNEFWRTALPEDTINFCQRALEKLDLKQSIQTMKTSNCLFSARLELKKIRAASNGKGVTNELAVASAYAEILERLSAGMEIGIEIGPYRQLHGVKGNTLAEITLYKYMKGYQWTHQDNIEYVARIEDFLDNPLYTKEQFDNVKLNSELLRHWVTGYSLVHNREISVPILFVKWISSTNGLASGNTIEEAIVHGACEIFERHATINFLKYPTKNKSLNIEPQSIKDTTIQDMLKFFDKNNIEVVIKDVGQGIYPVYGIITTSRELTPRHIGYNVFKAGSSFSSIEALTRCFTERMQGTSFDFEETQGMIPEDDSDHKYMPLFFKGVCPMNLDSYKDSPPAEFKHETVEGTKVEIDKCIEVAKYFNTDLIVINHTHPVFKFPTVRIVMPGISDFMEWWSPEQVNLDFIGNLQPEEELYEAKLMEVLGSFKADNNFQNSSAKNKSRRDT